MGWTGFDLDGTLAHYDGWKGEEVIGKPIQKMRETLLRHIKRGYEVKIFTARATTQKGRAAVVKWLKDNGFPDIDVTNVKDFKMEKLYDDRAISVVKNKGTVK